MYIRTKQSSAPTAPVVRLINILLRLHSTKIYLPPFLHYLKTFQLPYIVKILGNFKVRQRETFRSLDCIMVNGNWVKSTKKTRVSPQKVGKLNVFEFHSDFYRSSSSINVLYGYFTVLHKSGIKTILSLSSEESLCLSL